MARTEEFFSDYLPNKLDGNDDLKSIGATFQFDIEGAGTWNLDLAEGAVSEGPMDDPGCVIETDRETWETMLETPSKAIQLFMMGKIKASNIGLATQLQKILA